MHLTDTLHITQCSISLSLSIVYCSSAAPFSVPRLCALLHQRIAFHAATASKPSFEAARLFLAALQLTNNGNVVLHHPIGKVCGPNDLMVEVLSTSLAQERFDNYLAPSLVGGTN